MLFVDLFVLWVFVAVGICCSLLRAVVRGSSWLVVVVACCMLCVVC